MDPVENQVSVKLSRVATHTIPFGRAVQRAGVDKQAEIFGGALLIDDMSLGWTPQGAVTIAIEAGIVGNCNKMTVPTAFTTGLIAVKAVDALDLSPYEAIGFLIKSDTDIPAGSLQIGWDEGSSDMTGSPVYLDLPALAAGVWYFATLSFTGALDARDAVESLGLNVAVDLSTTANVILWVDEVRAGALSNGISGIVKDDEAKENDQAEQYDTILVLARGEMRAQLASGITCVSEQPLYPVPGTGEFTTTYIAGGGPPVRAAEDQATAGEGVQAIIG